MKESDFQAWLRDLASTTGWGYYHVHDSRRNNPGWPDTVLWKGKTLIFAELKVGSRKLTPEQRQTLEELAQVKRVECYVWRDKDRDEIEKMLKEG